MSRLPVCAFALLLVFGNAPHGHDLFKIEPLVLEGDAVAGVGLVTSISNFAVNNARSVLVEADTDHADPDADSVLLRDGLLELRENQSLAEPPTALLDSFDTLSLNNAGESAWNFFLDPFPAGFDSGVYFGTDLLVQEGDVSGAPEFTPLTTYAGFFECKINDDRDVLVLASVDDLLIPTSIDQALVLFEVDANGDLVSETVVVKEGDVLDGQTAGVETFETGPHDFDLNNAGQAMFIVELADAAAVDHAVYVDDLLVAQEGSLEPSTGRNWATLSGSVLDLNNGGDWVLLGSLEGDSSSNSLIVKNGAKFRQEGDGLAAIGAFTFTSFGTGPVLIDDGADVLWYGDWNDPDTDVDTGLFLNDELLVQEGVTTIGGVVVDTLRGVQDGYAMSDNGRYIVFEAVLQNGVEGAFEISLDGAVEPMTECFGGNAGLLSHVGGTPFGGDTLELEMDGGQAPGAGAFLLFSVGPILGWPPCGIDLGGPGELLVDVLPPNPVASFFTTWTGVPAPFSVPIPANEPQIGLHIYAQGLFADPGFVAEPFRLTNGLEITLGDFL